MDKNKLTSLLLISLILLVYTYFLGPKGSRQPEVIQKVSNTNTPELVLDVDYGPFKDKILGKEEEIKLQNNLMTVILSSKGARVKKVVLDKYKTYNGGELSIVDDNTLKMGLVVPYNNQKINTGELFFDVIESNDKFAKFALSAQDEKYIISFSLEDGYNLEYKVTAQGLKNPQNMQSINLLWHQDIKLLENDLKESSKKTTINYFLTEKNKFEGLKIQTDKIESKKITNLTNWVAVKQKFFTIGIVSEKNSFSEASLSLSPSSSENILKKANIELTTENLKGEDYSLKFYFGPNTYNDLKKVAQGFSNNLYLGWPVTKVINKFFTLPVFHFFEKYISNYGVIIFLLVIILKLVLLPLAYQSHISSLRMKAISPMLNQIKEKYKNDTQKVQLEQAQLYKNLGINPLSGCLPVLLQAPVLIAMFNFFPNAIELRQQSFLWAKDLSTYDSIMTLPFTIPLYGNHVSLFTILMTLSTILYARSTNKGNSAIEGSMKVFSYIMPISFMFILNSFPAALSFYYFISNMLSFAQQFILGLFVEESAIVNLDPKDQTSAKISKSRLQARLEKNLGNKKK
jgi:YidC/Oxa1 family membrane protein insertase